MTTKNKKPIRVFYSELGGRFYATRHYRELKDGLIIVTGEKFDVTNDIGAAIERHDVTFTRLPDAPPLSLVKA